jgi:hypothetical protein
VTNRVVLPACQAGNRFLGSIKGLQILDTIGIWPILVLILVLIGVNAPFALSSKNKFKKALVFKAYVEETLLYKNNNNS